MWRLLIGQSSICMYTMTRDMYACYFSCTVHRRHVLPSFTKMFLLSLSPSLPLSISFHSSLSLSLSLYLSPSPCPSLPPSLPPSPHTCPLYSLAASLSPFRYSSLSPSKKASICVLISPPKILGALCKSQVSN